jgi:hypothetical protein
MDKSSVNINTIFSPPQVDATSGKRYYFHVTLGTGLIVATANALRSQRNSYTCISPWNLFMELVNGNYLRGLSSGCNLGDKFLDNLATIIKCNFKLYIQDYHTQASKLKTYYKSLDTSAPAIILSRKNDLYS